MEQIKGFMLFKNEDKKNDKQPDYRLVVSVGDDLIDAGAGWVKEGKRGKFISGLLSDHREWEYEGKTNSRDGWHFAKDDNPQQTMEESVKEFDKPSSEAKPEDSIDAENIPF